uniref:Uncharacterized protein n=1 Tax=Anguilla anguilla TaxID=7936 RepID=A0A0E9TX67_ANGAN
MNATGQSAFSGGVPSPAGWTGL